MGSLLEEVAAAELKKQKQEVIAKPAAAVAICRSAGSSLSLSLDFPLSPFHHSVFKISIFLLATKLLIIDRF